MCGIFGVTGPQELPPQRLNEALNIISHRGPDHTGTWQDDSVFLGHQRLSILDLSPEAHQPMKLGQLSLVFNGEIYNHLELRQRLFKEYPFKTHSDTETLLVGFLRMGVDFLTHLKGMFALGLYDSVAKKLVIARDDLGIKPVYFYQQGGRFAFSSEIKALATLFSLRSSDRIHLETYLTFENFANPATLFKGVQLLGPGQVLTWEDGKVSINTFESCDTTFEASTENALEVGKHLIERAVKQHLLSDVPVGVFLSGGIDSSLVAAIARRHSSQIIGFTGFFRTDDDLYDERPYTKILAKKSDIPLHEVEITSKDFIENFDRLIWHLDEPKMGMGSFSQFIVAKEAAKQRKVMLGGHGGDELFGGYPMYKAAWFHQQGMWPQIKAMLGLEISRKEVPWLLYSKFQSVRHGRFQFAPMIFTDRHAPLEAFQAKDGSAPVPELFEYYRNVYLNGLLVVEDKVSMAHSLESRVPLWSQDLAKFAATISPEIKLKGGQLKAFLKDVAKPYLPAELLTAPKRGFPTPLRLWFRSDLKRFCEERLSGDNAFLDQLVSRQARQALLNDHLTKRLPFALDERRAHKIWMLLCLESWARQYGILEVS